MHLHMHRHRHRHLHPVAFSASEFLTCFPLPLHLRAYTGVDLETAMTAWNATNNTNSFNFMIGSAPDALAGRNGAFALETIRDFTAVFADNSGVERDATFLCGGKVNCTKWTNQTGEVKIGKPLPEAVWRTNHGR
jgi:hypothetical protein